MNEKYICRNCGHTFDDPKQIREPDGLETPPYRYSDVCPNCNSDDFDEASNECCDECGNNIYCNDTYYADEVTDATFCANCMQKMTADNDYSCEDCFDDILTGETCYHIGDNWYCENCISEHVAN